VGDRVSSLGRCASCRKTKDTSFRGPSGHRRIEASTSAWRRLGTGRLFAPEESVQCATERIRESLEPRVGYFGCFLGRTRTLDSHASRLRRKLNRDGDAGYVLNVWGVGYRLTALS
jgi:hypothetical protein